MKKIFSLLLISLLLTGCATTPLVSTTDSTIPSSATPPETTTMIETTTSSAETTFLPGTSASKESTLPPETSAPKETTLPPETSAPKETAPPPETSAPKETAPPPETSVPKETTLPPETTMPEETTLPPETTVAPDSLDIFMDTLTLEQKVGQLFIAAPEQIMVDGAAVTSMTDDLAAALKTYPLGGIILFGQNIQNPDQITALNNALTEQSVISPFICVDEEGGLVARLGNNSAFGLPTYENAAAVAASGDPEDVRNMGRTIGGYLDQYGFNLDFAPVADVNTNPNNPIIGTRAFSSDPEIAATMAAAFAAGLREQGVCATFKHFPGHGDTDQDSHSGLAVSWRNREQQKNCEWIPFRQATALDFIMIAHVALPEITGDMTPSTLSRQVVTDILREELDFDGLIITDAMNMGAITESYGSSEAAIAALRAGCDIVLMPNNVPEAFRAVVDAIKGGEFTEEWLDETVRRILEFKQAHGILVLP